MRKIFSLIILCAMMLCFVSCTKSNEDTWRSNAKSVIDELTEEMEFEGWQNIEWYEGLPDIDWGEGSFARMLEEEAAGVFMFTGLGYSEGMYFNSETGEPTNGTTIVVRVVFDEKTPKGERLPVWYFCEGGRNVSFDNIDPHNTVLPHEILDTHDIGIWTYMYTY